MCQTVVLPISDPRADFGCQNWCHWTTFGCQTWSPLAKSGPIRNNQNRPRGPLWQLKVVPQASLGCYEWLCFPLLTAEKGEEVYVNNLHET